MTNSVLQGYRLSPQQARLRALAEAAPELPLGAACALRLRGALDREALRRAVERVAGRHEILRTTLRALPGDGAPVQVIGEAATAALEFRDLGELPELERAAVEAAAWQAATTRQAGGDGAPPLRAVLFRRGEGDHVLHLGLAAQCADAPSLDALAAAVGAAYADLTGAGAGAPDPAEPFQYVDFSEWLHETLASDEAAEGRSFWSRQPAPERTALPDFWPAAAPSGARGTGVEHRALGPAASRRLAEAAAAHGTDAEAWLLAAWRVLLQRHAGDAGFTVGVAADGRAFEEMRGSLGPFTRHLPLRGDVEDTAPFSALAAATGERLRQLRAWQAFHEPPAADAGDAARPRFGFDHAELAPQSGRWGGVAWSAERRWHQTERFDLRLSTERAPGSGDGEVRVSLYFDPAALAREGAARLLRRYLALLEGTLAEPRADAFALPLLDREEREEALGLRGAEPASFPAGEPLHRLFERRAALAPDATAVVFEGESLTYRELDERAARLGRYLRARGVGPEARVGLCLERGVEAVVGILGILKAGGAYVPLDPAYPAERLAYVLDDAGIRVLLTEERLRERIPAGDAEVVSLDGEWERIAGGEGGVLPGGAGPDSLAYVIYTSGSTGRPKGVQVTHRSVVRLFAATEAWFGFGPDDVWTLFHSLAFDFSVWELWGALLHGGRLVVVPFTTSRSPGDFRALLAREGVTVLNQTPSAFRQLDAADEAAGGSPGLALRQVVFGGEALDPGTLRGWMERHGEERPRLVNMYGITETTVHVTWRPVTREDAERAGRSPVGVPIPDLAVHLLDPHLEPMPVGVAGEMFVGGAGVARGYLGRPGLTAERFVPDPFGPEPGARLYRSGDRARRLPSGELEYLGRADEQVKVRGFRIEPGEIEAALLALPGVREAVVVAREDEPGVRRLAAYLTAAGEAPSTADLRERLLERLPEYMVPSAFVVLERLPLTPNGKLDRRALPAPGPSAGAEARYAAPRTPTEEVLAAVWAEALGLERVGLDDNFFAVGGDSILSVRVAALARERGLGLDVADLFASPTVRALAGHVARGTSESAALEAILGRERRPFDLVREEDRHGLPEDAEDAYPLASLQAGMLYHQAMSREAAPYHNVDSYHFRGAFDAACFRAAVRAAVARQDNLRTSIHLEGFGEPLQVVHRRAEIPVHVEDIRHLEDAAQEVLLGELRDRELRTPFDLTRAPLLRMHVHLRADDRFHLTVAENHAINDGWSLTSLFADVFADHAALLRGEPLPERPRPGIRFRDFIELERATAESEASRRFWAERLAGFVPGRLPRLPVRFSDGAGPGTETVRIPLSAELREGLAGLARLLAVPLKSVLLAAHLKVLGLSTGERDVVTGLATNGRPEVAGGTDVRGLFLNTVPLRLELGEGSWEELVLQAFRAEVELLPHRRYPLARLTHEHGPERLFDASFNLVRFHSLAEVLRTGVVDVLSGDDVAETSHALSVSARLHPVTSEILVFGFSYKADALGREQARELADRYRRVMEEMVADPSGRHDRFAGLSGEARRQVLEEWNRTEEEYPADRCIHHLFEEQAAHAPGAVAVDCDGGSLTYRELNERANRLAHHLVRRGVGPEARVAICLERTPEMVVALLGVLKAGGAYVPLDPGAPAERLEGMLADSAARVLVTQEKLRDTLPAMPGVEVVSIDREWDRLAAGCSENPESGAGPANLAYVIYTSGSTGTPKGVAVEHRSVIRLVRGANYVDLGPGEVVLQAAPVSFDAATLELWGALLNGARLVLLRGATPSLEELGRTIAGGGVTTLWLTAGLFQLMVQERLEDLRGVRQLLAGGDVVSADAVRTLQRRFPACRVVNGYGPTENTTFTCCYVVPPGWDGSTLPVGGPVSNTQVYVLDAALQPVPVGVPGELYAGGAGLARGYVGGPGTTAERFVPDPFSSRAGARMYRTGDRVRWLPDGVVEYLGRLDGQVKVRGFRVEPGEVEAALRRAAGVEECIVVSREDTPGEKRLVAYVVGEAGVEEMRAHLRRSLPEYMVPGAFVPLDALPLTPNGKLDRRALPAPDPHFAEERYVAPRTPAEEILSGIWAEVLRLERVGVEESFFELGGHSLLATRVVSRVREVFAVEMPLRALFEHPTVSALALYVAGAAGRTPVAPPFVAGERGDTVETSFAQQRLWVVQQIDPESVAYNMPYALRVRGALDVEVLGRAFTALVRRHEALRTVFPQAGGVPMQRVRPAGAVLPPELDLRRLTAGDREAHAARLVRDEAARPFDLASGPLLRVRVLRLGEADAMLLFTLHHIVSDGWSQDVLVRDLSELYTALAEGREPALPPLPVQYADYALWQRKWLSPEVVEEQVGYWRASLAGAPPLLELPADRPRSAAAGARAGSRSFVLSARASDALRALSRREGATLFMTLLGPFQLLLARHSGQEDVVVGSPVAGRSRREVEDLIGFFVNMLPLRTELSGDPSFRELTARVRERVLDAHAHEHLPFEKLVDELQPERSPTHPPIFQVMFALELPRQETLRLGPLQAVPAAGSGEQAKFDLNLNMAEHGDRIGGALVFRADLFDGGTIERMAEQLERVLEQVAADPDVRLSELELMGAGERRLVLEAWNRTASEFPEDRCIHQLFEAQVERTPDEVAVLFEAESLTFRELDQRANRLAHRLREWGVGPEVRVGLCLERSLELMVSILGVLKAGGAYVPMDPAHPAERTGYVLADSGVAVLVTQQKLRERLPVQPGVRVLCVDGVAREPLAAERAEAPASGVASGNLAYVIYTSGSTGRPKGVAMHHRGVCNYIHWGIRAYGADRGSGAPVFSSMAVDLTITNLLPLFAGLPVRLLPEEDAVEALAQALRERPGFGLIKITPIHLGLLNALLSPEDLRGTTRTLVIGADFLSAEPTVPWQEHAPGVRLMNEYGPTETVVGCSAYVLPPGVHRSGPVPVGGPIQNLTFFVLDAWLEPVPVGMPGELYIGGVGVARGYLGRPGLTAEKFVPDPFAGGGARMYRTGDRARWLPGGNMQILGRTDGQVKVRGYRVELGEIEATLRRHAAVSGCLVVVREDAPGEKRLVAYVVGEAEVDDLREHLRRSLPEYMVPSAFVRLESLPQTPTGKLDPRTLPAPDHASAEDGYVAPRTPVEEALAGIWAETLRLERVGVRDSFFRLGGDSILAIQVVSRARRAGVEITPRQVFEHQTIAGLASVAEDSGGAARRGEQGRPEGPVGLTPIQAWFFEQEHAVPAHFNQSVLLEVDAAVGDAALEPALHAVLAHHDALRLRFRRTGSGWEQVHAAEAGIRLERVDLSALSQDARDRAQERAAMERQASLDLEHGPVGRVVLFDRGEGGRVLLLVLHHLVVDGVSWRILREDLEQAIATVETGGRAELGARSTSYQRWAELLAAYAAGGAGDGEAAYWVDQGPEGVAALPTDGAGEPTVGGSRTLAVRLEADETRALLHEVPAAYRTQINDVLLCALAEAVAEWTGGRRVRLALEGHGREEELGTGVDLTRTVGWFTSIYPVVLDLEGAAGPGERLKRVKEQLRAVPARGIGYGVLRYLSPDAEVRRALAAQAEPEIVFNYLGQFDQGRSLSERFRFAGGPRGRDSAEENRRRHLLDVNGMVVDGCLQLNWSYAEGVHRRDTIERLAAAYLDVLRGLIVHCREEGAGGFTPSDFPLAELTQGELDALLGSRRGVEDLYPLSPMQEGLLFHALHGGNVQAYQVQVAQLLQGGLDAALLQRAFAEVVGRHAILRTAFQWEGLRRPLQRVESEVELPWRIEDWRGRPEQDQEAALERFLAEDRARGFVLDRAPLMRCALFRAADDAHWIVWNVHHLLMDGWTSSRVAGEAMELYDAWSAGRAVEPKHVHPYREYIAWLGRQDRGAAERYWRGVLAGFASPTPLPADRGARAGAEMRHARRSLELSVRLTRRLEETAKRAQVTLNTVLQGAWALLLARCADEDDVVFGSTVSGRPAELAGVEEMVGLFINTLPVRVRVPGEARLGAWLGELQRTQVEAREFEYTPLVQAQGWSEVPRGVPLFESLFVFENFPVERGGSTGAGPRLRAARTRAVEWTTYPLLLVAAPGRRLHLGLSFDEHRFGEAAVGRMLGQLERVLEQVAADPDARLSELELLDETERRQLLGVWHGAERAYSPAPVHELFAEQARRAPRGVALLYGDLAVSYGELDRRAEALALRLRALGVGPEVPVGVCVERTPELLTAVLGIWKAGGAYVPLDPAYPAERLGWILADAALRVVVTAAGAAGVLPEHGAAVVEANAGPECDAPGPVHRPQGQREAPRQEPDLPVPAPCAVSGPSLAYVIYTSGSTGTPKGVLVQHGSLSNLLAAAREAFGVAEGDVMPALASHAFDIWLFEALLPLTSGAAVRLVQRERVLDVPALLRELADATLLHAVPALMREIVRAERETPRLVRLRRAFVGGDQVPADLLAEMRATLPGAETHVLYGPTEGTVLASALPVAVDGVAEGHPIGRPLANVRLYVCDAAGRPQPVGIPGELLIGGAGVARGYLRQPAPTAERFVPDAFSPQGGARLYRTGDRVRWSADGSLEYLGRLDAQVKIRGFRVEPGEIEAVLRRIAGVADCAVLAREDERGERRLVAYVVGEATVDDLRAHLRLTLPEYMVPGAFVALDVLPLTPNGKLDRGALPAPEPAPGGDGFVAPRTPVEEELARIWAETLQLERVGVRDGFFQLGGHSLHIMRIIAQVQDTFGVEISLSTLFARPTVEALAEELERLAYEEIMAMPEPEADELHEWQPAAGR